MKILTLGASPYLLTSESKIHKDIITLLKENNHYIDTVAYNHDVSYFLPTETGIHYFDDNGKRLAKIYPFLGQKGQISVFTFETMLSCQPDIVISIGNYTDTDFLWSIKSIYPHLFKWIAILPIGNPVINEKHRFSLSYADAIITTTKTAKEALQNITLKADHIPYGINAKPQEPENVEFNILSMAKNSQISNVSGFLKALKISGLNATLHANINGEGDYDIRLLIERYGLKDKLALPKSFLSIREGITDDNLYEMYRRHTAIVDCSSQSGTGLTMLEAMSAGCIPIGVNFGAVGEILEEMPAEFRFAVPYEIFIGAKEEYFAIVNTKELAATMQNMNVKCLDKEWCKKARQKSIEIANIFKKENFSQCLKKIVEKVTTVENKLVVDSY